MANEIKVVAESGLALTYKVLNSDGTAKTGLTSPASYPASVGEVGTTGYYTANDANVVTGDVIVVSDASGVLAGKIYDPKLVNELKDFDPATDIVTPERLSRWS